MVEGERREGQAVSASGWYVLKTPAGRYSVLWLFAGHALAVAGPFAEYGEAVAEMERLKNA